MTRKKASPDPPETPAVEQATKKRFDILGDSRLNGLLAIIMAVPTLGGLAGSAWAFLGPARLSLTYTSIYRLAPREDRLPAKVGLSFAGRPIESLYVLTGELKNTGSKSIDTSEIDVEPTIEMPEIYGSRRSHILDAFVLKQTSGTPTATCTFDETAVRFRTKLINGKERIRFQVVCEGNPGWPLLEYHIRGIDEPRTYRLPRESDEERFGTLPGILFVNFALLWALLVFLYVCKILGRIEISLHLREGVPGSAFRRLFGVFVLTVGFIVVVCIGAWYFNAVWAIPVWS